MYIQPAEIESQKILTYFSKYAEIFIMFRDHIPKTQILIHFPSFIIENSIDLTTVSIGNSNSNDQSIINYINLKKNIHSIN